MACDNNGSKNFELQFESFINKVKQDLVSCIEHHLNEFQVQLKILVKRINQMEGNIVQLTDKIDSLETAQRLNDVSISNIPTSDAEIVPDIVKKIGNAINFNCDKHYFSAFRIQPKRSKASAPPIIVKFALRSSAIEFINLYKAKKALSLNDIGVNSSARIYINQGLTAKTNQLLIEARKLQSTGKLFKTYIKSGMVYLLQTQNSEPIRLINMQHLISLADKAPSGQISQQSLHQTSTSQSTPINEATKRNTRSQKQL